MKKLLIIFLLLMASHLFAEANLSMSPYVLLKTTNTWTKTQVFNSSVTFKDDTIEINGVTYNWPNSLTAGNCLQVDGSGNLTWDTCGSGGAGGSYPDWKIDGSFTGVNSKTQNPLILRSLTVQGDLTVLNIYTDPQTQ